jgi:uncharacterized ferritin-like protein (DUF455 family)
MMTSNALFAAWAETDAFRKCALTQALDAETPLPEAMAQLATPGKPAKPTLIDPKDVPQRALSTHEGRAALLHAIAHIEFNAINLALDAALRFSEMPHRFKADWIAVAKDEARHFELLCNHLRDRYEKSYGDFAAHDGLWAMAVRTNDDVLARMALVPRVMEARGLDVTPGLIQKMRQAGDREAAGILEVILRDEVGHVAIGNRWYDALCAQRGVEPAAQFLLLQTQYRAPKLRAPFNIEARVRAGFREEEILSWNTLG